MHLISNTVICFTCVKSTADQPSIKSSLSSLQFRRKYKDFLDTHFQLQRIKMDRRRMRHQLRNAATLRFYGQHAKSEKIIQCIHEEIVVG